MKSIRSDPLAAKCRRAFAAHKQAALLDARTLDYDAADLLALARQSPQCAYCRMPLLYSFEFDHRVPRARTVQAHKLANVCCCCPDCNRAKGQLDAEEFHRLLTLFADFDPRARTDALRRLKAGGMRYAASRRTRPQP